MNDSWQDDELEKRRKRTTFWLYVLMAALMLLPFLVLWMTKGTYW